KCPVHREGDRITVDDPEIDLERTDALCTHALSTILHYTTILERNWCPVELGLTVDGDEEHAYMQCVDPGEPYTEGGTVIFQVRRLR
ncbi:MAG: TIGR04076 family protein, partial [Methanothermobacter sp.]|nr:TIGR04076 family protein [Methanothermobacter sp.]